MADKREWVYTPDHVAGGFFMLRVEDHKDPIIKELSQWLKSTLGPLRRDHWRRKKNGNPTIVQYKNRWSMGVCEFVVLRKRQLDGNQIHEHLIQDHEYAEIRINIYSDVDVLQFKLTWC